MKTFVLTLSVAALGALGASATTNFTTVDFAQWETVDTCTGTAEINYPTITIGECISYSSLDGADSPELAELGECSAFIYTSCDTKLHVMNYIDTACTKPSPLGPRTRPLRCVSFGYIGYNPQGSSKYTCK